MTVKRVLTAALVALPLTAGTAGAQEAADLRLAVPEELVATGLTQHLLPRFRFKTRIRVEPVAPGAEAEMALGAAAEGVPVFRRREGESYRLRLRAGAPAEAEAFLDWLTSDPGRAAVESFQVDGERVYVGGAGETEAPVEVVVDGDAEQGAELALVHCGRCHVIDARNPFGGIGSTPSFAAMRGDDDWQGRFEAFWSLNPHPAFTQVEGMTAPFPPDRPPPIAPLELTLDETRAIAAFVGTLRPKDLGARVQAR